MKMHFAVEIDGTPAQARRLRRAIQGGLESREVRAFAAVVGTLRALPDEEARRRVLTMLQVWRPQPDRDRG
jgi:hypothetical protein